MVSQNENPVLVKGIARVGVVGYMYGFFVDGSMKSRLLGESLFGTMTLP